MYIRPMRQTEDPDARLWSGVWAGSGSVSVYLVMMRLQTPGRVAFDFGSPLAAIAIVTPLWALLWILWFRRRYGTLPWRKPPPA
jgi:hypothetical protein